ncbi:phenoloxidase-activating factor 2-like [Helicoverpa zea]|uniref:phenoloxidase-activating factor 2-like n=1 Tax=Helicoverpa zea TaxID=7113 RepID=UPI001F580CC2|nr:phenoloxidase-activating factor 2-like [Helicoverpa zea]
MCLWILTACLGLLPANPSPIVVVPGVPAPIIVPTAAPTAATTAAATTAATTAAATTAATTATTTRPPTPAPTTAATTATTAAPTTAAPTAAPTTASTAAPTTATTAATTTTTLGPLPIDPRLGTTSAPSAALNVPPISGYSAQLPTYDSAVKFPRQRRSLDDEHAVNMKDFLCSVGSGRKHNIVKRQSNCACVPTGTCVRVVNNNGAGMIDIRIVTPVATQCPSGQEYCCSGTTSGTLINCGTLQTVPTTAITPAAGQANFGEFPWQALILTKQNDYIAGGVLVDQLNVLTVTHRLLPYVVSGTAPNVKVRLGEWDAAGTYEPVAFQEYTVTKVFSHPSYNANTLQYDIMVLRLSATVPITPNAGAAVTINRACLPPSSTTTYTGQRCWVSGWGKNMFGLQGQYQQILKKVDVPIVAPATCQSQLQTARLGASYVLDTTSFICAGGEANKDSCTGDGGSGLVCQVNGQWVVVGLVSWGLGCANANVPAAYVNIAGLLPWIQQQIATA